MELRRHSFSFYTRSAEGHCVVSWQQWWGMELKEPQGPACRVMGMQLQRYQLAAGSRMGGDGSRLYGSSLQGRAGGAQGMWVDTRQRPRCRWSES